MKSLFKLFQTQLEKYQSIDYYIMAQSQPDKLLREIRSDKDHKKLIKMFNCTSKDPYKLIKILSIVNIILLYSNDFFDVVENNLVYRQSKDEWINTKFLEPYYRLIIKCCTNREMYMQSKHQIIKKGNALSLLFYSINMLKQLFMVVQKMPFLGRYYKSNSNSTVSGAVQIIAVQAQKFYNVFKFSLSEILNKPEVYIKSLQDEKIMKAVFGEELIFINQQMKKLFLDKYFYPLGRGIGVKLFRSEQQPAESEKIINGILSNHEETSRRNERKELETTLFPGSGLVNWNYYEQTLLSGPLNSSKNSSSSNVKDLDQIVLSEQEQDGSKNHPQFPTLNFSKDKTVSAKETNSGSQQMKGESI